MKVFLTAMLLSSFAYADYNLEPGEQVTVRCDGGGTTPVCDQPVVVAKSCIQQNINGYISLVNLTLIMSNGEIKQKEVFRGDNNAAIEILKSTMCK